MRGLAWRCLASRSVKNNCSVGAIELMAVPSALPGGRRPGPAAPVAAERYQKVEHGSRCPRYVDSRGRRAPTSSPARYHLTSVWTAKLWRMSWTLGRCGAPAPTPVTWSSLRNDLPKSASKSRVPAVETKKVVLRGRGQEPVPHLGVGAQGVEGAGVEGDQAGLPELRVAHGDHAFGRVEVAPLEPGWPRRPACRLWRGVR